MRGLSELSGQVGEAKLNHQDTKGTKEPGVPDCAAAPWCSSCLGGSIFRMFAAAPPPIGSTVTNLSGQDRCQVLPRSGSIFGSPHMRLPLVAFAFRWIGQEVDAARPAVGPEQAPGAQRDEQYGERRQDEIQQHRVRFKTPIGGSKAPSCGTISMR